MILLLRRRRWAGGGQQKDRRPSAERRKTAPKGFQAEDASCKLVPALREPEGASLQGHEGILVEASTTSPGRGLGHM